MRFAFPGGLVLASLGLLVVPTALSAKGATVTNPSLPLLGPHGVDAGPGPGLQRHALKPATTRCVAEVVASGNSFVGIANPNAADFAGSFSGVLAGRSDDACDSYDGIGGGYENTIGPMDNLGRAGGSFIGAGTSGVVTGSYSFIGAGSYNSVVSANSFIGAGDDNLAGAEYAFVGGGDHNSANGEGAFVGAGERNGAAAQSFVGGGYYNDAAGSDSFVGGGIFNNAQGNGSFIGGGDYTYYSSCKSSGCSVIANTVTGVDSFIGDGNQNSVSANQAFVGGGSHNTIAGSAEWATVGGGHYNAVAGMFATIPGGAFNTASGMLSLAAGYHAHAINTGSFVWSDYVSGSPVVTDTAADQFVVRASGGTYVYSSENLRAGVKLAAGSGAWASLSDRDAKTEVAPLDDAAVLAKVATLPVSTWRYKTEAGVRHVGPMAQDFYAAFGVGEDDRHITSIDEDGVALAAIKALRSNEIRLNAENAALHGENALLRDRLAALEKKVDALGER